MKQQWPGSTMIKFLEAALYLTAGTMVGYALGVGLIWFHY